MWKLKMLKQAGVCAVILLTFIIAGNVDIPQLNRGSEAVVAYLSKNYTADDVMTFAKYTAKTAVRAPVTVTNALLSAGQGSRYTDPVDENIKAGETVSVYAAEAGTVSAVGENEKIGKFIKVTHGDDAESVYGNCTEIYVKELERVKRGQIIASFKKEKDTDFYYSLTHLK